jgi:ABC-type lipoprotein export system ATPase subunit
VLLRLEHVCRRYPRPSGHRIALNDVSLEIGRGQMVGIFGPSGAGKTTLLRVAAGLERPDSGAVIYDGQRMDRMRASERSRFRRQEIACIWAKPLHQDRLRVLDHVALPLLVDRRDHRLAERRAREALLACEAEACAEMDLQDLSDGELQRVAIARALVNEPRLLLADAPASTLSIVERARAMALLCSLARDARVAVLVTHSDAEVLLGADPILYMREGELLSADEQMGTPGRLYHFPSGGDRQAAADA